MATPPRTLTQRHLAVARLDASGLRRREIAETLGLNPSTVSHLRRSPAYRTARAGMHARLEAAVIQTLVARIVSRPASCMICSDSGVIEARPGLRRPARKSTGKTSMDETTRRPAKEGQRSMPPQLTLTPEAARCLRLMSQAASGATTDKSASF